MSTAQHAQNWRNRKKQKGLCPGCGNSKSRNGKRCLDCHNKAIEYNKKRFQRRCDDGLCGYCGENKYEEGKKSCTECLQKQRNRYANSDKSRQREQAQSARRERRQRILKYYGGVCICCGESELIFLAMDHINGGGNEHRRQIGNNPGNRCGSSSTQFYKWIENNDFPDFLQILCHNCNMGKHLNGGICPHKGHVKLSSNESDYNPVPPNKTFTQKTRYVYEGEGKPPSHNSNL